MPRFACGLSLAFGLLISIVALPAVVLGQTWNGGGGNANWTTTANWTGGVPPFNGTTNVFFGGTTNLSPIVDTHNPWSILSLNFNSGAGAFTIGGNPLTIGTGGITNNATNFETISDNITTNGSQIWNASGNGLQFNGNVAIASGNTLTLTSAASNIGLSGAVSGGNGLIASGAGGLFITGTTDNTGLALTANSGTVTLTKSSSASVHAVGSGGLTIAGGTVKLVVGFGGDQILDTAPVTINSGTFDLEGGTETIGALNGSATATISNLAIFTTGTLTVSGGGGFAGVIQDGGAFDHVALTVGGSTPLILTGASTYTGATTINGGGTLQLGNGTTSNGSISASSAVTNNGMLVFAYPISQSYSGVITGSGSVTKTGAGTLTLNGGASSYSGGTTINGGAIIIPNGGSLTSQGNIFIGFSGVPGQNGTLTVDGTGTVVQASSAFVQVGAFGGTTGTLNVGTTMNGATFAVGSNGIGIQSGSSVNIGSGAVTGTLTSVGSVFVNGGVLQTANSGSLFSFSVGQTFNVNSGGHASFNGDFSSNGTAVIDGAGSKLTVAGASNVGSSGFMGSLTLQNGSTGNTFGEVDIAQSPLNGSTWSMSVLSGSTATIGNLNLLFSQNVYSANGQSATFTVDGTGSAVTLTSGATVSVGQDSPNLASLTVSNNGTFIAGAGGTTMLNATGTINVNGGTADLKTLVRNGGILNFTSGSLSFIGSFNVGVGGLLGQSLILNSSKILTLTGTTTIDQFKTLTISGGTLSTGSLVNNGTLAFTSGTLSITGASGLTIGSGGPLGNDYTLAAGTTLNVGHTTSVNFGAVLDVNGGNLISSSLTNSGSLVLDAGSITVSNVSFTNQAGAFFYIGPNKTATILSLTNSNAGEIELGGATALLAGNAGEQLINTGLLHGDGIASINLTNNAGGEIRAESGKRIKLMGVTGTNNGNINLQGGTAEFSQPLTVGSGGQVNGHGTLMVPIGSNTGLGASQSSVFGLALNGTAQFSGGNTDVYGSVNLPGTYNGGGTFTGPGTGKLLIGAGANTVSFYGDVWNNGNLFRTAAGSYAVFFGTVHGASSFSGGGTVDFEGTYSAGNSPAVVAMGGNAVFGVTDTLDINLGGTTPGNGANNYAQVNVAANANLAGTLNLISYNGFVPVAGDKFTVMTYASATGAFSSVTGTTPAPGLTYTTVYSPTSLVVITTGNGEKTWGVDNDGNSSIGANWLGGVAPGGVGDSATFSTIITAPRVVTLDADTTAGTLKFDSPFNYTIAGPHMLTLQAAGATAAVINVSGVHGQGAHTISAPITLASDLNIVQNSAGLFTIAGVLNNAAGHNAITTSGSGVTAITGSINLGNATALSVTGAGTLRFNLTSGTSTIGTGVTATVSNSATLELAGSVSALSSGTNRANILNDSNAAAGVLVTGNNQQVGGIDGNGAVQVAAGASLTANHIVQSSLAIGGTIGSPALVTIAASDSSGNPLGQSSGLAAAGWPGSDVPFDSTAAAAMSNGEEFFPATASASQAGTAAGENAMAVPEPAAIWLFAIAVLGSLLPVWRAKKGSSCLSRHSGSLRC